MVVTSRSGSISMFAALIISNYVIFNICRTAHASKLVRFSDFMFGEQRGTLSNETEASKSNGGTRWAVLVAGSSGWANYRHQVLHGKLLV